MQQQYKYKQFTFSNCKKKSLAELDCILMYINEGIAHSRNSKDVLLRSKWILTELFTNASKHSNDAAICLDIQIVNTVLQITKSDHGEPFSKYMNGERTYFPVNSAEKHTYLLHKDDLSILYATVNESTLNFSVEDNPDINEITVQGIDEHFGLIIIAKSSDKFIYKYDSNTQTNIFTASILLQ